MVQVTAEAKLRAAVEAWIADDPDEGDRAELRALLDRAFPGADAGADAGAADAGAIGELRDRFADRLHFGTAGLRGVVAAGPNRMNRAVVRAATAAVASWLLGPGSGARGRGAQRDRRVGVAVGCDARHRSAEFAEEVAGVLAGAGIAAHVLPLPCPTPLLAFAVRHLGAAAGVMVTASHNPAADNGYKLYLSDGAQVIPPADAEIEQLIAGLGPLSQVPVAGAGSPLITRHGDEVARAYLDAVVAAAAGPGPGRGPDGAERRLHADARGGRAAHAAGPPAGGLRCAASGGRAGGARPGLPDRRVSQPGGAGCPRPGTGRRPAARRRPGDRQRPGRGPAGRGRARSGRRLAGADRGSAGRPAGRELIWGQLDWGQLDWGQLDRGQLAGTDRWRAEGNAAPQARLVASTVVSSTLLSKIAAAAGVRYAETLTGFKWIARAADGVPGARFVFGYEEALGYAVGDVVRDKDGIGAALAMLRLAETAKSEDRSVLEVYDDLERAHGVHLTSQLTLRTADQAHVMSQLRSAPPAAFGDEPVSGLTDLAGSPAADGTASVAVPRADVLIFRLPGARVVLRPSGTEPKIKCYIEITEPLAGRSLGAAREAAAGRLAPLRSALEAMLAALPDEGPQLLSPSVSCYPGTVLPQNETGGRALAW